MAMSMLLRWPRRPSHGSRLSKQFLDWAAEQGVAFEVAEQCLARARGDAVWRLRSSAPASVR